MRTPALVIGAEFDRLVSILSPMWMPDRRSIVFSGLSESGVSDLYRVQLPGKVARMTNMAYGGRDRRTVGVRQGTPR